MQFNDFIKKYTQFPTITPDLINLESDKSYLRTLISSWLKKKWLLELKRGHYVINQEYFKDRLTNLYIANQIYQPSYISMESALSIYGIIPEGVFTTTSISTRKTTSFKNDFGNFKYYNLKPKLYWGFRSEKKSGLPVLIAEKEKALLDFLYLSRNNYQSLDQAIDSYRLDNLNSLKKTTLRSYLERFNNAAFSKKLSGLL